MKAKYFYILFVFLSAACVLYITQKQKPRTALTLVERNANISNTTEWINTKAVIEKLLGDLRANPNNLKSKMQLALAYIQESRVTGNHGYYDKVALELVDEILEEKPNDYEALCAKATVLLSQHHFTEALVIGKKLIEENPHSAYSYGILTDAYVELGKYEDAIAAADKMVSIRPDIRSYSRVSYLREIFGDTDGAIEAMKMAVEAGVPGTEQTEWSRVYTGRLYEMKGNIKKAEDLYRISLYHRPQYAYALAGLGRIEIIKGNLKEAEKYFTNAKFNVEDYSFSESLSDIYRYMQKPEEANNELKEAIDMLSAGNGKESDVAHGHYSDRELALLYLKIYKYDLALQHALTEYNRRPENIDVNQTLAWVRYRRGEYDDANKKIDAALKTNCKNPVLLLQAGMIKAKAGNMAEGKKLLQQSLAINKYVSPELKFEARDLFGDLNLIAQK